MSEQKNGIYIRYDSFEENTKKFTKSQEYKICSLMDHIVKLRDLKTSMEEVYMELNGKIDDVAVARYNTLIREFNLFLDELHRLNEQSENNHIYKDKNNDKLISYWYKGLLKTRTYKALARAGINTIKDLTFVTESQLKNIRNIGKTSYEEILCFCKAYGIVIGLDINKVPIFSKGDIVISLTDTIGYKQGTIIRETVKKGTIFEVVGTNSSKSYFSLLSYQCHPLNLDVNIDYTFFSPSEIVRYD